MGFKGAGLFDRAATRLYCGDVSMATLNLSLPQSLQDYIDERIMERGSGAAQDYVVDLIREDQVRHAQQHLETLIDEAIDSGEPFEVTEEYWENKRRQLVERHSIKQSSNEFRIHS